jgi:hypothetical protein
MKKILPDLLLLSGAGLLSYGSWLIYPPAGFVVGGILVLIQGVMMSRVA